MRLGNYISGMLFLFSSCNNASNKPVLSAQINKVDEAEKIKALFYQTYKNYILRSDGSTIPGEIEIVDTSETAYALKKISNGRYLLVFRYSYKDCEMCINSVFRALKKAPGLTPADILIITDSYSFRDFKLKVNFFDFFLKIFSTKEDDIHGLGLPIENKNVPFFFLLSPTLQASKFFIPYKELPGETEDYIRFATDCIHSFNKK